MMLLVDIHYLFASFTHSGKGRAKVSKPHKNAQSTRTYSNPHRDVTAFTLKTHLIPLALTLVLNTMFSVLRWNCIYYSYRLINKGKSPESTPDSVINCFRLICYSTKKKKKPSQWWEDCFIPKCRGEILFLIVIKGHSLYVGDDKLF